MTSLVMMIAFAFGVMTGMWAKGLMVKMANKRKEL